MESYSSGTLTHGRWMDRQRPSPSHSVEHCALRIQMISIDHEILVPLAGAVPPPPPGLGWFVERQTNRLDTTQFETGVK